MKKIYSPTDIENKWYKTWEENNFFSPNKNTQTKPYCIMIPPPNVTGYLHMGHAFQDTLMDSLIRYKRLKGNKTLWQMGTDHAGIATQMVVERKLQQDNITKEDLGREKFVEKIWDWKKHSGNNISRQLRRLGASVDWSSECFTMDENLSKAVQKVFIDLYDEGLIYRGQRLVNWDPILKTAVSDLEVKSEEEAGSLWYIKYPIKNQSNKYLTIATTRPETMLGDSAVAVNPDDNRYKNLIGEKIILPITNREIPIIADEYVDLEFGTGCVKITPAHDFNDNEVGRRHNLEQINILTFDAKINTNAPKKYQGLDRFEARKLILEDLENLNLLEKTVPHTLKVPRGDRTNSIIEPLLTNQWFMKTDTLAKPALDAVKNGDIKFVPENWSNTYYRWLEDIQDWCISRQLWWGHRIPAWYDENGKVYVGKNELDVRTKYNLSNNIILKQDDDVLDTWFSSALWPFSTLGWPEKTDRFNDFFPTNVLVTGFDIIFFWVARMIMLSLKFTKKVPFSTVYIHGLIQDQHGNKMSKSKGNVLDPMDFIDGVDLETLIEKRTTGLMQPKMKNQIIKNTKKEFPNGISAYGTDALRFAFFSIATGNRHIKFDINKLESCRNFCNKIWNASRYVFMNTEDINPNNFKYTNPSLLINKWILSIWQKTKSNIEKNYEQYRFDLIAHDIYDFVWNQYCDWYLEFSKSNSDLETKCTLLIILEEILKVMHPITPFITEEIWDMLASKIYLEHKPLIISSYPEVRQDLINTDSDKNIEFIKEFIIAIRNIRGEINISPNKIINILLYSEDKNNKNIILNNISFIKKLANLDNIIWLDNLDNLPLAATAMADNMKIFIPMKGLIDVEAEVSRLNKELEKLNKEITKSESKLQNEGYVKKAPIEVVNKERENLAKLANKKSNLEQSLLDVSSLK